MKHAAAAPSKPSRLWIATVLAAAPLLLSNVSATQATPGGRGSLQQPGRFALIKSMPRTTSMPRPTASAPTPEVRRPSLDQILDAVRQVESGGCEHQGTRAIGDDGRAIGPFQIHRDYWLDSGIPGRFEDCFDAAYARRVVLSYWRRHCPEALDALDAEVLARVHNGGPTGHGKSGTAYYWRKVERALARS